MTSLLRKLLGIAAPADASPGAPAPLKERRQSPRVKAYSAESGYVYEYVYEGYRDMAEERQHIFTASADRKSWFTVPVHVPFAAVAAWEQANARTLNDAERYAVAKLALFAAFDQRESPRAMETAVTVDAEQIAVLLESIDL